MNSVKILLTVLILTFILVVPAISATEKEKDSEDFAVPAFADLSLLGTQSTTVQMLTQKQLNPALYTESMQWLDINRDFQFNDFDSKQFQAIIEGLRGENLTGLQLIIRFREEQKNQGRSFPIAYDLDRDGMFTTYDVDAFAQVVNALDEGSTRGNRLIQKFKERIYPQSNQYIPT